MRINALGNTATDFASDDYIAIDGATNGSQKMAKGTLLEKTAQNTIEGNVADEFDPTRTISNKYLAGEIVSYGGLSYKFLVDHYGAWSAADVTRYIISKELENTNAKFNSLSVVDHTGNVDLTNDWESGYLVSGTPAASQYAWRTKNFYDCTDIDFVDNSAIVHIDDEDYKFVLVIYDSDGNYVKTTSTAGTTTDLTPTAFGTNRKYKIYIMRVDNTRITSLTDYEANAICYIEKTGVEIQANVGGATELLNIVDQKIATSEGGLVPRVEQLESEIQNLSIMPSTEDINLTNDWESGYFVSGVPTASQYGWRTKNFYDCTDIDFVDNSAIVHIDDEDYKFVLVIYDSDGNYVKTTSTAGTTTDLTPTAFGTNRKYKIYIMRVDNTRITSLTDYEANAICYIEKTGVEVPANVAGATELLDIVDEKIAIAGGSGVVEPFTINKIAFIGDSFTMLDVYTKKVVELFGLTNSDYRNYGISGYGVMDFVEQNKKSWIGGMDDCQISTFWLGTNDFAQERPLGDFDSSVTTDFTGCLRDLLSWWCSTSAFDNQLKLVITPCQRWGYNSDPIPNPTMTNGLGITLKDYSDRIKDVAHDYGIAVLDFYEESGIDKENAARTTRDGLHPTDTYFERLGIRIAKAIKNKCV